MPMNPNYKALHKAELREYKKLWKRHRENPLKYPPPKKCIHKIDYKERKQVHVSLENKQYAPKKYHCKGCDILLRYGGSGTAEYCEECANERGILSIG